MNELECLKQEGDTSFYSNEYTEAIGKYEELIALLSIDDYSVLTEQNQLLLKNVMGNASITYVKCCRYDEAYAICSKILDIDTNNVKALYRRALCLGKHMDRVQDAKIDLSRLLKIEPMNQQSIDLLRDLNKVCMKDKVDCPTDTSNSKTKTDIVGNDDIDDDDQIAVVKDSKGTTSDSYIDDSCSESSNHVQSFMNHEWKPTDAIKPFALAPPNVFSVTGNIDTNCVTIPSVNMMSTIKTIKNQQRKMQEQQKLKQLNNYKVPEIATSVMKELLIDEEREKDAFKTCTNNTRLKGKAKAKRSSLINNIPSILRNAKVDSRVAEGALQALMEEEYKQAIEFKKYFNKS